MLTVRISLDRARVGRGRDFIEWSRIVERGEAAWEWLRRDERGRVVGLVIASVAMSIAMSLLATVVVRAIECRRTAGGPADEDGAHVEAEAAAGDSPARAAAARELPVAPGEG